MQGIRLISVWCVGTIPERYIALHHNPNMQDFRGFVNSFCALHKNILAPAENPD